MPTSERDSLRQLLRAMENGPHGDKVKMLLAAGIPAGFATPPLPFCFLLLLLTFASSCFFNPQVLSSTLEQLTDTIDACTKPDTTHDPNKDGALPWDCAVSFTEVKVYRVVQVDAKVPTHVNYVAVLSRADIPPNVTHIPGWARLRFETVVNYSGVKNSATPRSSGRADRWGASMHESEYWVLTELHRFPPMTRKWRNDDVVRTFEHTLVPVGFGNHSVLFAWWITVLIVSIFGAVGFVCDAVACYKVLWGGEAGVRLYGLSAARRWYRAGRVVGEGAAIFFTAVALAQMRVILLEYRHDTTIDVATVAAWHRVELFIRWAVLCSSLPTASFIAEMSRHLYFTAFHGFTVTSTCAVFLVSFVILPASRMGLVAALPLILSVPVMDALTLPIVLTLTARLSPDLDEMRQVYFENQRDDSAIAADRDRRAGNAPPRPAPNRPNDSSSSRLAWRRARERAVVALGSLCQLLLYTLAVFVAMRPLLKLSMAPEGAFLVTGNSFLSANLGLIDAARKFE